MAVVHHGYLYSAAKTFTDVVDISIDCIMSSASAISSCTQAAISTVSESIRLGVGGTSREVAKAMFGYNDVQKGLASFRKQDRIFIDDRFTRLIQPDTREFSQRLGELSGHVASGASKAIASTVLAAGIGTYAVGSFRNSYGWTPISDYDTVAQTLAIGVNGFTRFSLSFGMTCGSIFTQAANATLRPIINNPYDSALIAAHAGGIGACLYLACKEGVKAANADGIIEKAYHAGLAAIGVAGACVVPTLLK